jgi:hypothetical protein
MGRLDDRGIFFTHLQLGIGLMDPYGKKHFNKSCSCTVVQSQISDKLGSATIEQI